MRIIHLIVPHLPLQVERRKAQLEPGPIVIGGCPWDPTIVMDCCELAEAAGVKPGMALARAALRCPEARILPAQHEAYQTAQTQFDAAARQFTDQVETAGLGSLFLEVGQLARRYPEDVVLTQALIDAIHEMSDLDLQVGLAEEHFTAEQAAQAACLNTAVIVPPRRGRTFLAPLPLSVLPAEAEILRRLSLLGVYTLGDLAALPRVAVIRQFGVHAGFLHDLASGADPRPVFVDAPQLELRHNATFDPPTADRYTLQARGERIAAELAAKLAQGQHQAQGLRIQVTDVEGVQTTTATSVEPPTGDEAWLARRIVILLEQLPLKRPVETLEIVGYPLRPVHLGVAQLALFSAPLDQRWQQLQEALRRLRARFGELVVRIAALVAPPDPRPIEVKPGVDAAPSLLIWRDDVSTLRQDTGDLHTYRVRHIYEHWRERRSWWAHPQERDYYRLEDTTGTLRVVYLDRRTNQWWLERRRM
jgi:nucleotidyltransferase/DNA polymerase involved in DNA repair